MDMSLSRKLLVAFSIGGASLPAKGYAADMVSLAPVGPVEAQRICASIDNPSIPPEKYVHACMAFYLGYMRGVPAELKAPFHEDLQAIGMAQAAIDKGVMTYDDYFKTVSEKTCKIAEEFRNRPLMDWALGEVVVGVAEMVQGHVAGNRQARIPVGAGETFQGCKPSALTS